MDPECLSLIRIFPSQIQGQKGPGSRSATKNLNIFNPNTVIVTKLWKIRSRMFIQDLDFFPSRNPDPRVKKHWIPEQDPKHWCLPGSTVGAESLCRCRRKVRYLKRKRHGSQNTFKGSQDIFVQFLCRPFSW